MSETPPQPPKIINASKDQLTKEWADKKVSLPRWPFFWILFYQAIGAAYLVYLLNWVLFLLLDYLQFALIGYILIGPFLFIGNMVLYLWVMVKLDKILIEHWRKISPHQEGVFSREFVNGNVNDMAVHYYHLRGFVPKWPVFYIKKSPFDWLVNFVLTENGENKIHKNALYVNCFVGLEFTDLEENVVIMDGSSVSSHVVDGIFGKLTLTRINFGENSIIGSNIIVGPGSRVPPNLTLAPVAMLPKDWSLSVEGNFIWGIPARFGYKGSMSDFIPNSLKSKYLKDQN
jgi:hypothetical protein